MVRLIGPVHKLRSDEIVETKSLEVQYRLLIFVSLVKKKGLFTCTVAILMNHDKSMDVSRPDSKILLVTLIHDFRPTLIKGFLLTPDHSFFVYTSPTVILTNKNKTSEPSLFTSTRISFRCVSSGLKTDCNVTNIFPSPDSTLV